MTSALKLSVYKVSGTDATTLLQGQLTQDMTTTEKQWRYAAHCNPKGRVISLYISFALKGQHYLITPTHLAEAAIKEISKYIMRSDVSITACKQQVYFESTNNWHSEDNVTTSSPEQLELHIPNHGKLIIRDEKNAPDIDRLNSSPNAQANWDSVRIAAGVPQLHLETIGLFTPESLNLDLNQVVSFTKGCYTGQEIVARMHYLGKAKQRLFTAELSENLSEGIALTPNMAVTDTENKTVGYVVDCITSMARNTEQKPLFLATLKVEKTNQALFIAQTPIKLNR